ncbi:hypothetical protein [Chondrinema litorale]|uniref:hypothetical protein n=1 Tax=Chondrinema litorale TaxID=2994555 RepID=UPI002543ED29|nr:hypothetical protein [Chondrinema litorale]UZR98574.1 hypothetical protein OQ292_32620 [Chondrinema litorale]
MDNLENKKVISTNPFSPSSKISENDLLNSGFTQVTTDMPILGKKVKNVKMNYTFKYFSDNHIKQVLKSGETIHDINFYDFILPNKPLGYSCEVEFENTPDSLILSNFFQQYSVEIISNFQELESAKTFSDSNKAIEFFVSNTETSQVFLCLLDIESNGKSTLYFSYSLY